MNLILDLDGTLICDKCKEPHGRPFLSEFIQWSFATYQHVSVWTASSASWLQYVLEKVLNDTVPFGW